MFVVCVKLNSVEVSLGQHWVQDVSIADVKNGLIGYLPVFDIKENAEKYASGCEGSPAILELFPATTEKNEAP